jgi:hypothetical protein
MTTTIDANQIYYQDGTTQTNARYKSVDSNTSYAATNYAIGTYLLCDTKNYNGKTNPLPLDGWGRYYSGPSLMTTPSTGGGYPNIAPSGGAVYTTMTNSLGGTEGYLQPCIMDAAYGGTTLSGTWQSRGSCLTQAFVVRIA